MITDSELGALHSLWETRWAPCPPIAHQLRAVHHDRWVRFHSLPGSKRYPKGRQEWRTVLERYHTVLDELFADTEILIFTCAWSGESQPSTRTELDVQISPERRYWRSLLEDDSDPESRAFTHIYVDRTSWNPGSLDTLLRAVARSETTGVMISEPGLSRIYHPYDGGADVILTNAAERDELRERHRDWLSSHPHGL